MYKRQPTTRSPLTHTKLHLDAITTTGWQLIAYRAILVAPRHRDRYVHSLPPTRARHPNADSRAPRRSCDKESPRCFFPLLPSLDSNTTILAYQSCPKPSKERQEHVQFEPFRRANSQPSQPCHIRLPPLPSAATRASSRVVLTDTFRPPACYSLTDTTQHSRPPPKRHTDSAATPQRTESACSRKNGSSLVRRQCR